MHGFASNLSSKDIEVFVLVPVSEKIKSFKPNYKILSLRGLNIFNKSTPLFEVVLFINLLFYQLKFRFDIIQAVVLYPAAYLAIKIKRFFSVKVVARPTGEDIQVLPEINYGLRLNPKIKGKIIWTIKNLDGLVANSNSIKEEALKLGCRKEKVWVIGNGVDTERFKNPQSDFREKFNLPKGSRILLTVGRSHPKKDYSALLKAFSLVTKEIANVYLVIVGGGTETLRPQITNLKLEAKVILTGKIPRNGGRDFYEYPASELVDIYLSSDLFVFSSLIEGQPNVLLEAQAAGLPIVATYAPGNLDVVEEGKTGFLVPVKYPEEFAEKVWELLKNENLYKKFSQNAKIESKKYSWENVTRDYLDVYTKVLNKQN